MTLSLGVDVIVGVILIVFLLMGCKRGLMRSLLGIAILLLAMFGATWCASHLAEPVSQWLASLMEKRITAQIPEAELEIQLPAFLTDLIGTVQDAGHGILAESILGRLQSVAYAVIYLIAFVTLLIGLRVLGGVLRIVEKLPVIHGCNKLGGAILGLLTGIAVVLVALWVVVQFSWLPSEAVQDSYFAKYFLLSTWLQ